MKGESGKLHQLAELFRRGKMVLPFLMLFRQMRLLIQEIVGCSCRFTGERH